MGKKRQLNFRRFTQSMARGEKMEKLFKLEGAVAYLTKPFVFKELLDELKKSLDRNRPPS